MSELVATDHWKIIPAMLIGAFVVGIVAMIYARETMRKWLLSDAVCPQKPAITTEEHTEYCDKKWKEHAAVTTERWSHNLEIAAKNRELLLVEIEHIRKAQEKMGTTVEKIFDRLEQRT